MSLVKHKGSSFWYYTFRINGKAYFKSTKTTNKKLATDIERKARDEIVKNQTLGREAEPINFGDALEMFIESKIGTPYHKVLVSIVNPLKGSKRCNKTKKQVKVYGLDFDQPIHLLKTPDINRFVQARRKEGSAEATIKQHVAAISGTFKFVKQLGYLVDDNVMFPSFERSKKQPVFLTAEEEQKLLLSLDPQRYVRGYGHLANRTPERQQRLQDQFDFVVGLLDVGCRFNELAALTWKDIDLPSGVAYVYQSKTKKADTKYLTNRFMDVLVRRSQSKTHPVYVFPNDSRDGPRVFHNAWFNRAVKRAGIEGKKITHHNLRKTFASKLVQQGVSLYEVSKLLGHSDVSTTQIYAGLIPTDVSKKAVGVLNALNEK